MITEIRGVHFHNKGAELMLHSTLQKLNEWEEHPIVAMRSRIGSYKDRANLGLYQIPWSDRKLPVLGAKFNSVVNCIPQKLRHSLGIITEAEIDVVLDASGFAYSDQWGLEKPVLMAELSKRLKKKNSKIVLLPQAFGPFDNSQKKNAFLKVLDYVDLVFARDKVSYKYLTDLVGTTSKIKIAPDFTNLVSGHIPSYYDASVKRACVIPNNRMLDKTSKEIQARYVDFLVLAIDYLAKNDLKPFILIHDSSDRKVVSFLKEKFGSTVELIDEPNPLSVKGILGSCHVVVGSRFHGLISALSQGVPCIGTGWSHKYEMLFEDYECDDLLISSFEDQEKILYCLKSVVEEPSRSNVISKLEKAASVQKELSSQMWNDVHKLLYL